MVSGWCPSLYFGMAPVGTVAWPEREDWKNCELVHPKNCFVFIYGCSPPNNRVVHRFWHNMGCINKTEWFCHEKWWFYQHKICFTRQAVDFTCSKRSSKERRTRIICRSLSKSSRSQKAQKMSLSPCSKICATAKPAEPQELPQTRPLHQHVVQLVLHAAAWCKPKAYPTWPCFCRAMDTRKLEGWASGQGGEQPLGCCFDRGSGRVLWAIQRTPKSSAKGESYAKA